MVFICLYDFLQYYGLSPRGKKDEHDIEWRGCYDGVEKFMLLKKKGKRRIPIINVFDFVDTSVITSWCMGKGWPYVALSRVRTLKGVFLRLPLKEIKKPGLAIDVRTMLQLFRNTLLVKEDT